MDYKRELEKLNEKQKAAVLDESKACVVNANVGSGKTTVLISKIIYLHYAKSIAYSDMVVLTFTNKAANEIKERLLQMEEKLKAEELQYFGTFHSVALYLLKNHLEIEKLGYSKDFCVIDPEEELDIALRIIQEEKLVIKYKNRLKKRLEQDSSSKYKDDFQKLKELLRQEKIKQNKMSFADLLTYAVNLYDCVTVVPKWILIDEVQDSDKVQMDFIRALMKNNAKLFAVGDPNQVIYSWRGSVFNVFYVLRHEYDARELSLTLNYRSGNAILEVAKRFLENGSALSGSRESGSKIIVKQQYDSFQEASYLAEKIKELHEQGVPYKEIAVFYRLQNQSEMLEKVFEKNEIPYEVSLKRTVQDIPVLNWLVHLLRYSINEKDISSGIYALSNKEYGSGLTEKQAAKLVKEWAEKRSSYDMEFAAFCITEKREELLRKMLLFRKNFGEQNDKEDKTDKIYEYFELDSYLHPTSSSYQSDKDIVNLFLNNSNQYIDSDSKMSTQDKQVSWLQRMAEYINSTSLQGTNIVKKDLISADDSVRLMTLHASKGLEFSHVFIIGVNYGLLPIQGRSIEDEEEERRLFFVGITRAKDYLELSFYTNPDTPRIIPGESRFIRMIPQDLIESSDREREKVDLRELKKQILAVKTNMKSDTYKEKRKVSHSKYGKGIVINEDDVMITVAFEGYGEKEFIKGFSELIDE